MKLSRRERRLLAYHDGELSGLSRWWVGRSLRHDASAQEELARWSEVGEALRADAHAEPSVDLWAGISEQLESPAAAAAPSWHWRWPELAAGAAVACLAIGWWLLLPGSGTPSVESIRWLDARGKAVMVLQDDAEATIIWVPGPDPEELSQRRIDGLG